MHRRLPCRLGLGIVVEITTPLAGADAAARVAEWGQEETAASRPVADTIRTRPDSFMRTFLNKEATRPKQSLDRDDAQIRRRRRTSPAALL